MKLEMKKMVLVMAAGIVTFSGAFGAAVADADAVNADRMMSGMNGGGIQELPKFKKVKIVNEVRNRAVEVFLNEGVSGEAGKVDKIEVKGRDNQTVSLPGNGVMISKIRLALKDKKGHVREKSKDEIISWANAHSDKAQAIQNIIRGVNVTMERDPSNQDTLVVTITKKGAQEKVTSKQAKAVSDK